MKCIICDNENDSNSVEHIVSESFGNKDYVMQKGEICDGCNNKFSKFENKALTNTVFVMERSRFGIETKKGNTAKGKVKGLEIEGDENFKPNYLNVKGLDSENFKDFDPKTKSGHLYVSSFDKSESATSKLLLKTGIESIYKSQRKIYNKYNFRDLKDYLKGDSNTDWPFIVTDFETKKFNSIPTFTDKYNLKRKHCNLSILEVGNDTVFFKFKYGAIPMVINLINRNTNWILNYYQQDNSIDINPEHIKNKIINKDNNKGSR